MFTVWTRTLVHLLARCYMKQHRQGGWTRAKTEDDMRQVSNLLLASESTENSVCLPLVRHLHRALLWLFNRRRCFSYFNEFLYILRSPLPFASPESNALLHEKCSAVTGEVLNILIFAAPMHRSLTSLSEWFFTSECKAAALGFPFFFFFSKRLTFDSASEKSSSQMERTQKWWLKRSLRGALFSRSLFSTHNAI